MKWRRLRRLIGAVVILLGIGSGYHSSVEKDGDSSDAAPGTYRSGIEATHAGDQRRTSQASRLTAADQLLRFCQGPSFQRLSSSEEDECWRLVRGMSAQEVREILSRAQGEPATWASGEVISALYFRWAQINPHEAAEAWQTATVAASSEKRSYSLVLFPLFAAWIKSAPEEALKWAQDSGDVSASSVAGSLATELEFARGLHPDLTELIKRGSGALYATATEMAKDQESREAFSKAVATSLSPDDAASATAILYKQWMIQDRAEALEKLPADLKNNYREAALSGWKNEDPAGYATWTRQSDSGVSPPAQIRAFDEWSNASPGEALTWLGKQESDFTEAVAKTSALSVLGGHPADDTLETVRARIGVWQSQAPEAANAWLDSLPESFRRNLENGR